MKSVRLNANALDTNQIYGLLNIHIDTGTDCLFETNMQSGIPPYGKAPKVAREYGCGDQIEKFLISENPLHRGYNSGAMGGFFAKLKLPFEIGKYAGIL